MSTLPYICLQPDYPAVFSDLSSSTLSTEKVWLSIYTSNAPSGSIHATLDLHAHPASSPSDVSTQGGVRIATIQGGEPAGLSVQRTPDSALDLLVSTSSLPNDQQSYDTAWSARALRPGVGVPPTRVRLPTRTVERVLPAGRSARVNQNFTALPTVEAFDVSPTGNGLFVAGGEDGALVVGSLLDSEGRGQGTEAVEEDGEEGEALSGRLGEERRVEALAARRMREREESERRARKVYLKGHVGDVRSARFFPSGEVVITTSSDLTTRIFSALDGSNPRTLTGHKRAVLCSGILGRGREVLTGGGDGTVRLYDVGAGKQTTLFGVERFSSVNAISVPALASPSASAADETQHTPNEFAVGLGNGCVELFDVRAKKRIGLVAPYAFPPGPPPRASDSWTQDASTGPVSAVEWFRSSTADAIVCGSEKGIVSVWDARMLQATDEGGAAARRPPRALLGCWRRNTSAVNSIRAVRSGTREAGTDVLVATADGLPYRADVDALLRGAGPSTSISATSDAGSEPMQVEDGETGPEWYGAAARVTDEYAGWDCDPTSVVAVDHKGRVVIAGADARVRRY